MALISKTYTFEGKKAGSTEENKAIAMLNGEEFTQEQYDNIFGSSLELPNEPSPVLEFEFPYEESLIQQINIYFKSKVTNGVITCESGDYGVFKRDNSYSQKQLNIYENPDKGTMKFKITTTDDIAIYEVKIEVFFDDTTLRKYSGVVVHGITEDSSTTDYINSLTFDEFIDKLKEYPNETIQTASMSWNPVVGEIIP